MPPGWYSDPWSPAALRWWDGTQWTPHAAPRPGAWAANPYLQPPTAADLAATGRWARRASAAVVVYALASCTQILLFATLLHSFLHDFFHQLDEFNTDLDNDPNAQLHLHLHFGHIIGIYVAGLVLLGAEIVFIIWFFKAAEIAERLLIPHRLKPIWAILGFIIPIVNFWFPYQVAADLLAPGDPARPIAGWWWGWYLGQGVVVIPVFIVSFASTTAAVIIGLMGCAVPIAAAVKARELIAAVTQRHAALAPQ